jgi:hypothetical protein
MKRSFIVLVLAIIFAIVPNCTWADDVDMPSSTDLWDNWNSGDDGREVKPVSDEEFDKAIESLSSKKNKRLKKKQIPKGEEFHQGNETDFINENAPKSKDDGLPVVCIPVDLVIDDAILPVGHYQIKAEKTDDGVVMKFFQAQYLMAQVPAVETEDDFGEDTISFGKWNFEDDGNKIKFIFGSMDLNAYTEIKVNNPQEW